jgi:hypothetical protein
MNTPSEAPLVTLGLVTYNQEKFVAEALHGALAQQYDRLEIVVCDDASTDNTFDVLRKEASSYQGPHTLNLHRNSHNLGIGNYNRLMELSKGCLVVIAHGDDISQPNRVAKIVESWQITQTSLISSNALFINPLGQTKGLLLPPGEKPINTLENIAMHGRNKSLLGSTMAWERDVFDLFSPLDPDKSPLTTDWILPFRAAMLKGICYVDEPLVQVRLHMGQKYMRYFGEADQDARGETLLTNSLVQYLYMLDTLMQSAAANIVTPGVKLQIEQILLQSFIRNAQAWRTKRNRLLAGGKRSKWVSVEE